MRKGGSCGLKLLSSIPVHAHRHRSSSIRPTKDPPMALILASAYYLITRSPKSLYYHATGPRRKDFRNVMTAKFQLDTSPMASSEFILIYSPDLKGPYLCIRSTMKLASWLRCNTAKCSDNSACRGMGQSILRFWRSTTARNGVTSHVRGASGE